VDRFSLVVLPLLFLCVVVLAGGKNAWAQIDPGGGCDPNKLDSGCPSDGNPCTTEICDATTKTCTSVPVTCAGDGLCSPATCNPATGQCEVHPVACTQDGNLCTTESCNPATGQCESGATKSCANDGLCSTGSCNPATGQCVQAPVTCEQDGNLCTVESCNPSTGQCASGAPKSCANDSLCSTGSCNPATGQCSQTPVTCTQDGDLCTTETCNPATGQCASGAPKSCANDSLCSTGSCNPSTGQCSQTPVTCTQDSDDCTTEVCDPTNGTCHSVPANPTPGDCGVTICRTPGFWGTHAGTEKAGSTNITQAVITAGGGVLTVCGQPISNTVLSDDDSAVEAICVNVSDGQRFQLARQMTSASLNCVVSNGVPDCTSTPLYSAIFTRCNATCANAASSTADVTACVNQLDCLNNGGKMLANGYCQTGTCASNGTTPCKLGTACSDTSACVALDNNCHDQLMINSALGFNFEPPGPAGSSTECNSAIKNACKVIGSAQSKCQF